MVKIGAKRQRITIEERSQALNDFGQPLNTWSAVATLWAEVRTLAGRELATARQVRPETSLRVTVRGGEYAVTAAHRIDFAGRKLSILAVMDLEERGRETVLDCSEWKGAANP